MDAVEHVVLGAGAVGMAVVEAPARPGESVRVVNRSGLREPMTGVQSVAEDISDLTFAEWATHGARVVYQALNPPYHRWPKISRACRRRPLGTEPATLISDVPARARAAIPDLSEDAV